MRITVDLDTKDFRELQRVIRTAFDLKLGMPDEIRKSPSGRGYHIIWRNVKCSKDEALAFRAILGDDDMRIFFDIVGVPFQVLFRKKKVKKIKRRVESV